MGKWKLRKADHRNMFYFLKILLVYPILAFKLVFMKHIMCQVLLIALMRIISFNYHNNWQGSYCYYFHLMVAT